MTERLEEIKTRFNAMKELESFKKLAPTDLFFDDLNWLLQQAERVQELEELTHKQGKVIIKQSDELDIFDQQNKRYREALKEIRSEASSYMGNSAAQRLYNIADKALEGDLE